MIIFPWGVGRQVVASVKHKPLYFKTWKYTDGRVPSLGADSNSPLVEMGTQDHECHLGRAQRPPEVWGSCGSNQDSIPLLSPQHPTSDILKSQHWRVLSRGERQWNITLRLFIFTMKTHLCNLCLTVRLLWRSPMPSVLTLCEGSSSIYDRVRAVTPPTPTQQTHTRTATIQKTKQIPHPHTVNQSETENSTYKSIRCLKLGAKPHTQKVHF